ncbi:DUF2199 domain-containing protein [Catellatospora sp. NPDC049111]|uniref:DUF2199 domain-containing protein n=1 Tax=Catellatospora sp. NPDC049111 TaxID=3155271 RepID=UPI0033E36C9D
MRNITGHTCGSCGRPHEDLPLSYRTAAPAPWTDDLADDPNSELTADLCVISGRHFFVQGNLEIPIIGRDEVFTWGVWVSLSPDSFARTTDLWDEPGRESERPYFGWLSTELAGYPVSTLNLKTNVHTRPVGRKPYVEVEPTDHPLAVEQRTGITTARIHHLADLLQHGSRP